jgi:hypothetical protein
VIDLYKDILRAVEDLATCSYTSEALSKLLARIQAAVTYHPLCSLLYFTDFVFLFKIDRLNLEVYANLDYWVAKLDKRIESILLQRLMATHVEMYLFGILQINTASIAVNSRQRRKRGVS